MKKILVGLFSYVILASIVCLVIGMFNVAIPNLIAEDVMNYRWDNAFLNMLIFLPSSAITGFLLGCAISFADVKASPISRYTPGVLGAYKIVLVVSLGITLILSFSHDIFLPRLEQRKLELEQKPTIIEQYLELSKENLSKALTNSEYGNLAIFYAKKVQELDPKNQEAKELESRAEFANADRDNPARNNSAQNSKKDDSSQSSNPNLEYYNSPTESLDYLQESFDVTEINEIKSSSVYELVQKAQQFFEDKDYLGAHYYAQVAVRVADPKDVNLEHAREIANNSWNILSQAQAETLTEENKFFRKKLEGYTKLTLGDYMSAYYIFQTLSNSNINYAKDSDVKRYLTIAQDELTKQYFFIDETKDKNTFESAENVYFSLHHGNGTYDVFYIKGITDVKQTGNMVRYLREVHIYSFDQYGDFVKTMFVPYAKMISVDVNSIGEQEKQKLEIDEKWKTIPYLLLCSVDRDREDVKVSPIYKTDNGERVEGPNQIFLSMPYSDLDIISQYKNGIPKMNFWNMNKMKRSADSYGYSNELNAQGIMTSIFYPFVIMIILLLAAIIAWNYRLQANQIFKLKWVFIVPFVHFIFYGVVSYFEIAIKLMNFIFIGIAGINGGLYVGLAFYMIIVVILSFTFLARKGD